MNTNILNMRIPESDHDLLRSVCEQRGETVSSFVRRAFLQELARLSYFPADRKKALGITPANTATTEVTP